MTGAFALIGLAVMMVHHSPSEPVFADAGSLGVLYELDAQVLMLAPLKSNTCMHMGEERGRPAARRGGVGRGRNAPP